MTDEVNPKPYTCKHACERDALKDEIERLRAALEQIAVTPNAGWMIARTVLAATTPHPEGKEA